MKEKMWDELVEHHTSEEALQLLTNVVGYSEQTLRDALYCLTGENCFEFEEEEEEGEE